MRERDLKETLRRGSVSWGECKSGDGRVVGTEERICAEHLSRGKETAI